MTNLIKDSDNKVSIGRLTLGLLMTLAIAKFWYFGLEIPDTMASTLAALLLYELGKKGRDAYISKESYTHHYKETVSSDPS
jgi:hypothetical protein